MLDYLRKLVFLTGITILTVSLFGCSGGEQNTDIKKEQVISVNGMIIEPVSKELKKVYTGTLEGELQAPIRAKVSEAVAALYVREGDKVRANDKIIGLDKTGSTSSYYQTRSVFLNAEKNYKKMKFLFEQGAVAEVQFDEAETNYEVARANFEAARQAVDLITPIAGTVTSIDVSVGDFVVSGQQVATVAQIDKLRIKLGVNAEDIKYFTVNDRVTVYVESISNLKAVGEVVTVAKSADPVTRTFQVDVELDNSDGKFNPGMFARAEIVIESFEDILVVPHKAIIQRGDEKNVFLINGDQAKLVKVRTGVDFNGMTQVTEGMAPGDTVITLGQEYLDDGFKVRLNEITPIEIKESQS